MKTLRIAAAFLLTLPLAGCLVMSYSTRSGLSIWPGSIVLTLIIFAVYYLARHR